MAVDDTPNPLERATRAIREEDTTGWVDLSQSIRTRVRTLVTPAVKVTAYAEDGRAEHGDRGSTIHVSGRVLTPRLRDVVDSPTRALDAIDITVTDDRCSAVHVSLVCAYGSDLQAHGAEVRAAVAEVVRTVIGPDPAFDPARDIQVAVVDVVEGDPHRD